MAKNMARITDGIVTNIEWCSDRQQQTETLIDLADRPISVSDTYIDGKFYRDGVEILTPLEEAQKQIAEMEIAHLEELGALIEEIYQNDMEVIENV